MKKYEWGEDPEMSGPRNYFRESLMVSSVVKNKKKGNILDAGCGSGNLSIRLAEKGFQVTSVDLAQKSLIYLKGKIKKKKLEKKISVIKASLLSLPFKKNAFDGIVCGEVLEHIKEDTKVINQFYNVLKKNGICVITVPAQPKLWDVSDDISGHVRRYTKEELYKKFHKAGFEVQYCVYWGYPLNNIWHQKVFLPFLERKMETSENITQNNNLKAKLAKNKLLQKFLSNIFYIDFLFGFLNKGNAILLIAKKRI